MCKIRQKNLRRLPVNYAVIGMTDLAFALLIIFVITVVPVEEKGLSFHLESWSEEPPDFIVLQQRNVLSIWVDYERKLFVKGDPLPFQHLTSTIKNLVKNPSGSLDAATDPRHIAIVVHFSCYTPYKYYLYMLDSIKTAYREMWEEEAIAVFGRNYDQLLPAEKRQIRNAIPMTLREDYSDCYGF